VGGQGRMTSLPPTAQTEVIEQFYIILGVFKVAYFLRYTRSVPPPFLRFRVYFPPRFPLCVGHGI